MRSRPKKERKKDGFRNSSIKAERCKTMRKGWSARCPAHDDQRSSLTVREEDNGLVLMYCHAECSYENICRALGISNIAATYDYDDESGKLLYQVIRTNPKGFFLRKPDGKGEFTDGLGDTGRVLYRLSDLLRTSPKQPVFIPEGEKDVDALCKLALTATCNSGGAGKWRTDYNSWLRGRNVVVLPDNDSQGEQHGREVANSLLGIAASVKIVRLPGLAEKGDISDWLAAGGTRDDLLTLLEQAPIVDSRWDTSMNRENMESGFNLIPLSELLDEPDDEVGEQGRAGASLKDRYFMAVKGEI